MSASWYDVLGVGPDAETDEIRAAWKASVADLDPTDRRFALYNDAAGVLLDPAQRSEYDAGLSELDAPTPAAAAVATQGRPSAGDGGASEPGAEPAPVEPETADPEPGGETQDDQAPAEEQPDPSPGTKRSDDTDGVSGMGGVPAKLLAVLTAVVVVMAATAAILHVTAQDPEAIEDAMAQARAAAENSVPKVIAYDYKFPERSHDQAMRVLTGDLRTEYDQLWQDVVAPNLEKSKASLKTSTLATGLVGNSRNGERVEVMTILKVDAVNSEGTQSAVVTVTATMVRKDGDWLIVELDGWDPALSEDGAQSPATPGESSAPGATTSPSASGSASPASDPSADSSSSATTGAN